MRRALILGILAVVLPVTAWAADVEIAATDVKVLDVGVGGTVLLTRFDLPQDVKDGRVTRAIVSYAVDCGEERELALRAFVAPAAWESETVSSGWWSVNSTELEARSQRVFETDDCAEGIVHLDVTPWVRAWAAEELDNHGLVITAPDAGERVSGPINRAGYPTPVLRVVYR